MAGLDLEDLKEMIAKAEPKATRFGVVYVQLPKDTKSK